MLERKIRFETEQERANILNSADVMRTFWNCYYNGLLTRGPDIELFVKVGSVLKPVEFNFDLVYIPSGANEMIHKIDEAKFIADALRSIQQHKVIDEDVYKKLKSLPCNEGDYLIAFDKKPAFKVKEEPNKPWAYNPITIESYDGRGMLKHHPKLDKKPYHIDVDLSVQSQRKEKLFVNICDCIVKHYEEQHMTVLEPARVK